jgi:hypothetical protein
MKPFGFVLRLSIRREQDDKACRVQMNARGETMQTRPIQLTDVIYNAATQCFEALVTVQDGEQLRRYACAIDAPITMSYRDAADGLSRQALRRHAQKRGLNSEVLRHVPAQRAGRRSFDPLRWLEEVMHLSGRDAA